MQQLLLRRPSEGVHQTVAIGAAVLCMTAATHQLCSGLASTTRASRQARQHQLVRQRVSAMRVQNSPSMMTDAAEPAEAVSPTQRRLPLFRDSLQPKGPGSNDRSAAERLLNVLTSVPFLLVGGNLIRAKDSSPEVRQVGAGLLLAGGTACAYHATHPGKQSKLRSVLRKLDYWTVSLATAALVRAAGPRVSQFTSLSSLLFVPLRPTAVTLSNITSVELQLIRHAYSKPALRPAYRRHALALAAGGCCFAGESTAIEHNVMCVHALWHCFAALAVSSGAKMLSQ